MRGNPHLPNIHMYMAIERQIINQSTAARLRGVSRQRISELYSKGRFTIPVDDKGKEVRGAIYLDELETLAEGKRGRPPLTEEQRTERGLGRFSKGDTVVWEHKPRDGFGYTINITGTVEKVGASRVLLNFKGGDGNLTTAWVNQDLCALLARPI